jgi:hypothetical protein
VHRDVAFVETGDELGTHLRRDEQAKQDQRRRAGHDETARAPRAARSIGSYACRAQRMKTFSFSEILPPRNSATAAGTNVIESRSAAASAIMTV